MRIISDFSDSEVENFWLFRKSSQVGKTVRLDAAAKLRSAGVGGLWSMGKSVLVQGLPFAGQEVVACWAGGKAKYAYGQKN